LVLLLAFLFWAFSVQAEEIRLVPESPENLGDWAKVVQAFRLYPTPSRSVRYEGPTLATQLWGDLALGQARYALLLGVTPQNAVELYVDLDRDNRISPGEKLSGTRVSGGMAWTVSLRSEPPQGSSFDYPLQILWPEGRGYLFLVGGAVRAGEFRGRRIALVDGDLDGVFGTKGDFLAVDVDGDGKIYAEPDGHERFSLNEPFTLGGESFRAEVPPDGRSLRISSAAYTPPKVPLIPGSPAPNFTFREFRTGENLSLASFRGKVVLLDFWATWCPPCMASLPGLLELYREFHAQGFEIVGVSLDESAEDLRRVIASYGIPWPIAFEGKRWDNSLANLWRVYQIPTAYLLDKQGIIRFRDLEADALRKAVSELLSEPVTLEAPAPAPSMPEVSLRPEPILELRVPKETGIQEGKAAKVSVRVINTSPYLAEEVRFSFPDLPPGWEVEVPAPFNVPAFGEREAQIQILFKDSAGKSPPAAVRLSVDYHYCIKDACFQMSQEEKLAFVLGASPERALSLPWWILALLAAGVLLSWFLFGRNLTVLSFVLVGLGVAALLFGVFWGQARQAQRIASVLCTSCVGIEEARAPTAEIPAALLSEFQNFPKTAHLMVFYTPWCKSCPYAKALVAQIASVNPRISVELIDADEKRAEAEASGVIRNGKAVVPAIVIRETGKILFGTEDLAPRILAALREIP
jgi:thiol-disulfide isomerase/thioredoxin